MRARTLSSATWWVGGHRWPGVGPWWQARGTDWPEHVRSARPGRCARCPGCRIGLRQQHRPLPPPAPPSLQMGETPLIRAAHNGHLATVRLLVEAGADVNALDMVGAGAAPLLACGGG